ncbi:unnamed protein product [Penicillium nalgiovense]|nr:unnamed protein product [Penicillium nalgiovense]CAG8139309.1 unnamed protein product [Penicillium nalgiovense]
MRHLNTTWTSKSDRTCGRYCSQRIHFAACQPIKETRLRLAGPNVYGRMSLRPSRLK